MTLWARQSRRFSAGNMPVRFPTSGQVNHRTAGGPGGRGPVPLAGGGAGRERGAMVVTLERSEVGAEPELRARMAAILNRHPAVGLVAGVVRDGRLVFVHSHGLADIASNVPVDAGTVFRVGSVTKTFTAVAVLQLHEQGAIDLDEPAEKYLRAYRLPGPTIRHLLTHTGGIPEVR